MNMKTTGIACLTVGVLIAITGEAGRSSFPTATGRCASIRWVHW